MIDFTMDAKGRSILISLSQLKQPTDRGIRQGLYFLGRDLRATANANILKTPRSGRARRLNGRPRGRASVQGESFANLTGKARRTLGFDVRGADSLEFGFRAGNKTAYTKFLEDGTSKMGPRPTLEIAMRSNLRNMQTHLEREMKRAIEDGFK